MSARTRLTPARLAAFQAGAQMAYRDEWLDKARAALDAERRAMCVEFARNRHRLMLADLRLAARLSR